MTQLEKALVWVTKHRKENKSLAQAVYRASWRFNVREDDLLTFVRHSLQK